MICASNEGTRSGAPSLIQRNTPRSSAYAQYGSPGAARGTSGSGVVGAAHGYLQTASSVARVRLRPALRPSSVRTFASRRVSTRRFWALALNPPQGAANASRAASPLCPNGGWAGDVARLAVFIVFG